MEDDIVISNDEHGKNYNQKFETGDSVLSTKWSLSFFRDLLNSF